MEGYDHSGERASQQGYSDHESRGRVDAIEGISSSLLLTHS